MADSTAWTPLSGWTENGDGSWSQVPTAQAEPRLDGYLPIVGGTLAGLVVTVTPTAASAGFRLPHGTAPSSPTDGDVWTTTAGLYVRVNGATVGPLGTGGGTPASSVTTLDGLQSAVTGVGTAYARDDHKHAVINLLDLGSTQTATGLKTFQVSTSKAILGAANLPVTIQTTGSNDAIQAAHYSASGDSPFILLAKSRNSTLGAHTVVNNGDALGWIGWQGSDGTAWREGAFIKAVVDNASISSTSMPARLDFLTSNVGSVNPTRKFKVGSNGLFNVYTDASPAWMNQRYANDANSFIMRFTKSRATALETDTVIIAGDYLASIDGQGYTGSAYATAGGIDIRSDPAGTVSTTSMPGQLIFNTTANGATSATTRLTIDMDGYSTFTGPVIAASASNAGLTISNTSTNGANLKLVGNGGTTPNKSIRAQGGNLEFVDSGYTNVILTLGDTGILTGANVWKPVTGTTTKAPLQFTAGTNLTTAAGGAVEYDGDTAYLTPDGSAVGGRGVLTSSHLYALNAARNLSNATGAQSIFGVGFTLAGSTSYLLEMEVAISCSGTTTAIKSLGFALGGTLTSIGFNLMYTHSATSVGTSAASNNLRVATNAATAMGATGTTNYTRISLRGVVRSNATGTFTPQITYSAAPGAAPAVQANSYITLTPIGNGTVQGVGAWA